MIHAITVTPCVVDHDVRDKPAHIFYRLQHNAYNGHGHVYHIQKHIHDRLLRISLKTCEKSHYLLKATLLRDSISLHNHGLIQCNEPLVLHPARQGNVLHILRKLLHNLKAFELALHVCALNGGDPVVVVPFYFNLSMRK
jgi:hypothetical protein